QGVGFLFQEPVEPQFKAFAGMDGPGRAAAERRASVGSLRQRHVHLFGLRVLSPAACRSPGRRPSMREPVGRWTWTASSASHSACDQMNQPSQPAQLAREIGLREATALNMIDMIGVGPFITLPLIIHAMGGPQAMLGWILGALLAICDGLVWAELGASLPEAGGSYQYLKESFGAQKLGRLTSFLFVWQLQFSAPLSIASGCIGIARYAVYLWEPFGRVLADRTFAAVLPLLGRFE